MKVVAYVLGVLCIIAAVVYFVLPADQLPAFMPGHDAAMNQIHAKHGIAAAVVHLRGRRRGGAGWRGAGEGSKRKGIQGKAAADAVIAGQKSAVITARRCGRARRGLLGLA